MEKLKRSEKESETELKRLKKELEAAKLKAEAQAAMALKPLAPINQNSEEPCIREGNKRKRVCLDPDVTAVESTDVKQETETPEPPKPEMPVPVVWHLPDFFLEQGCNIFNIYLFIYQNSEENYFLICKNIYLRTSSESL